MPQAQKSGCAALLTTLFTPASKSTSQPIMSLEPKQKKLLDHPSESKQEKPPYRLTQAFLSPAEISFYHILQQVLGKHVVICPKVSLGDLFYPQTGDRGANQTWRNKIDRKHVDFLLCNPKSMLPLMGIELDDASHEQVTRQERDHFVEEVFAVAGLPLFRQPVRHTYHVQELATVLSGQLGIMLPTDVSTHNGQSLLGEASTSQATLHQAEPTVSHPEGVPTCPNCLQPMVLRTIKKAGPQHGQQFWGCQDYPRCRGMRPYQAA